MKRIRVGKWSFEQSTASNGYHLFKQAEIVGKDGKKRKEDKLQGYDMSLKNIINVISEDESFFEEVHLNSLLEKIDSKIDDVAERILKQLK